MRECNCKAHRAAEFYRDKINEARQRGDAEVPLGEFEGCPVFYYPNRGRLILESPSPDCLFTHAA